MKYVPLSEIRMLVLSSMKRVEDDQWRTMLEAEGQARENAMLDIVELLTKHCEGWEIKRP
jgi:hypothetical protein